MGCARERAVSSFRSRPMRESAEGGSIRIRTYAVVWSRAGGTVRRVWVFLSRFSNLEATRLLSGCPLGQIAPGWKTRSGRGCLPVRVCARKSATRCCAVLRQVMCTCREKAPRSAHEFFLLSSP